MGETVGKRIKELRLQKNMTLEELGNKVGVGKSTVRKWETGAIANMRRDKIWKLADALDVPIPELMGWIDPSKEEITATIVGRMKSVQVSRVPILSEIPCGEPAMVYNSIDHDDFVEIDSTLAETGEYYGLRARGDSMLPKIEEGDIMIVHYQQDVESGQVAIVRINGEDATCKRVRKHHDGIELFGYNPSYTPRFFSNDEIKNLPVVIMGRVIEVRSKL